MLPLVVITDILLLFRKLYMSLFIFHWINSNQWPPGRWEINVSVLHALQSICSNAKHTTVACLRCSLWSPCYQVWICSWGKLQRQPPPVLQWKSPSRERVCPSRLAPASAPPMSPSLWASPSMRPQWTDVPARYTALCLPPHIPV